MKDKENRIGDLRRKLIYAIREYPLQLIGAGLVSILFCAILVIGLVLPDHAHGQAFREASQIQSLGGTADPHLPLTAAVSYADLVERVVPSVVTIRSERRVTQNPAQGQIDEDLLRRFFGGRAPAPDPARPQIERGLGSGVVIASDGTIVTNNHVVAGATRVRVDLADRRTFDAKIVGTDPASDLAVLKIDAADLPALPLGDSDKARVGDVVLAIGNPLGLRQTVTSGIISAKGRQTGLSDGSFEDFIQTDAPINQGNSGGALVNLSGELIGINSQILSPSGGNIGIGFAIPSNMTRSVIEQLEKDGKVHRGMLGIGIQDVTPEIAENLGLKDVTGVIVNSVKPGSPAESAGLMPGDIVRTVNDLAVADGNDLRNRIAQTAPGTEVTIGYERAGKSETAKAKLGEAAADGAVSGKSDADGPRDKGKLGLTLTPVTPEIAKRLDLKNGAAGLVISEVENGSAAEDAGLRPGDVIVEANRIPLKTVDDFRAALEKGKPGLVLLLIERGGDSAYVTVRF